MNKEFTFSPESYESLIYSKLYLLNFNSEKLNEKWDNLTKIQISNFNDQELRAKILEVMSFHNDMLDQNFFYIPGFKYLYEKNTVFCRVRKMNSINFQTPDLSMNDENDVWSPLDEYVKNYGRLNFPNEGLLYTASQNTQLAIEESKIKSSDFFLNICYENIEDVYLNIVGFYRNDSLYTDEENLKLKMLSDFFKDIFSKAEGDSENNYRLSSNLIKTCYNIEKLGGDGWVYPSIISKSGYNACFIPGISRQKLKTKTIEVCKLLNNKIRVFYVGEIDKQGMIIYHKIGSEFHKNNYPSHELYSFL